MLPLILSAAAFAGSVISAVAGLGGGALLIGVMFAVGLTPVVAIPLHAAVQMVANGSRVWAYRQDVDFRAAGWFLLSCTPLPFLVAPLVARADVDLIRLLLAAVILASLLPVSRLRLGRAWSRRRRMLAAGVVNGSLGMLVGATGVAIGPFFLRREWSKETTVGTLALCQTLGHALKLLAFAGAGYAITGELDLLALLALAVALGTGLGRALMRHVSRPLFEMLFKGALLVLALRLAFSGARGLLAG